MARKSPIDRVIEPQKPGPVAGVVAEILAAMGSTPDRDKAISVAVYGKNLHFRYAHNTDELRSFRSGALEFLSRLRDEKARPGLPRAYREALAIRDLTPDDLVCAYLLHFWSHESTKISEVQALQMVAVNPTVAFAIVEQVDEQQRHGRKAP